MYDVLEGFLTGYLHQDWDAEYDSDTEAAQDFASSEPLEQIKLLLGEVAILTTLDDDAQFDSVLASFRLDYLPQSETRRDWLRRLAAAIAISAAQRAVRDSL